MTSFWSKLHKYRFSDWFGDVELTSSKASGELKQWVELHELVEVSYTAIALLFFPICSLNASPLSNLLREATCGCVGIRR
jgi:hypothetical protein